MPPAPQRLTFVPDLAALAILGRDPRPDPDTGRVSGGTSAVNSALVEFAGLIEPAARELAAALTPAEWSAIADACNGWLDLSDPSGLGADPLTALCHQLADCERFSKLGRKWKINTAALVERLETLTPAHGFAALAAVRWFWQHPQTEGPWWEPAFRVRAIR